MEYNPPTRMSHICSSLISYFKWKTHIKIVSYHPLVRSHQVPIDYIDPKSTWSTDIATPYVRPSMVNPTGKPQYPHIIPSDEDSI